jgi:GTP cyclohydrolase FolE2
MRKNKMDREGHASQAKANKKLASSVGLKSSCPEALQNELWKSLTKLEHRAEILTAISHNQRTSGRYELAEAYKKQAMNSMAYAQSIRKLLMDLPY